MIVFGVVIAATLGVSADQAPTGGVNIGLARRHGFS